MKVERNAISPIVELLDVIATYAEFLQADGQDVFHVKALADDLRPFLPSTPENVDTP